MPLIAQDAKGSLVEALQHALNEGGADLRVDGDFGTKTKAALLQAQRAQGSSVTGTVETSKKFPPRFTAGTVPPADTFVRKLPVPWLSQRDNWNNPSGTCNLTSCAMALAWAGTPIVDGGVQLEDTLHELIHGKAAMSHMNRNFAWAVKQGIPPQQVLGMLEWLLRKGTLKFPKARFTTEADKDAILDALDKAPVILSGKFTKSGHIVVVVGKTQADDLIVNDPWGDWTNGYATSNGAARVYPMEQVWKCLDKGRGRHWALTVK